MSRPVKEPTDLVPNPPPQEAQPQPTSEQQQTPPQSNPPPRPSLLQDSHVRRMLAVAQERLDRLFREAVGSRFYGRVCVEISFENGRPMTIRRQIEGMDK